MIYHKSKQVGFIEHGKANIDKIMHNDECVFTQGFDTDNSGTDSVVLEGTIGKDLMDWSIVGNTYQASQPSPSSPVSVLGVGDRTRNLFDVNSSIYYHNGVSVVTNGGDITVTKTTHGQWRYAALYIDSSNNMKNKEYTVSFSTIGNDDVIPFIRVVTFNKGGITGETEIVQRQSRIGEKVTLKFTVPNVDDKVICVSFYPSIDTVITGDFKSCTYTNFMLNEGSEPLPYEPYGVKIPVTCYNADHTKEITTPIYLLTPLMANERLTPTAREVKWGVKVFDGSETIGFNANYNLFTITSDDLNVKNWIVPICSHFASTGDVKILPTNNTKMVWIADSIDKWNRSINDFKSFIKSEYDKGTPVTVWYQLATPTTEPVETNLIGTLRNEEKTIKGTTTIITTDTEVLPTQIEASYKSNKVDYVVVNFATTDGNIFTTANGDTYTIKMRKSQYDTMMTNELLSLLEVM